MRKVISLDIETSGFSPHKNEVLEIGAVAYFPSSGERRHFSTLILNAKPIDPKVSEIHGITAKFLVENGAVNRKKAFIAFLEFCKEDCSRLTFVGHNIKRFDLPFIKTALGRVRLTLPKHYSIHDTYITEKEWVKRRYPKKKVSLKLEDCCARRRIPIEDKTHRALYDAELAFRLYQKQWKQS